MGDAATEDCKLSLIGALYTLDIDNLKKFVDKFGLVCEDLSTRSTIINSILHYIVNEEKKEDGGMASWLHMTTYLEEEMTERTSDNNAATGTSQPQQQPQPVILPDIKSSLFAWKRDFKISGQIGNSKNALRYSSLLRQIEDGIQKGFSEKEVINAVINAIEPNLPVRSYLEDKSSEPGFCIDDLKVSIKTHFQEPSATELHQSVGNAVQRGNEGPPSVVWCPWQPLH